MEPLLNLEEAAKPTEAHETTTLRTDAHALKVPSGRVPVTRLDRQAKDVPCVQPQRMGFRS